MTHFEFFSICGSLSRFGVPKCEEEICSQFLHVNTEIKMGAHCGLVDMGRSSRKYVVLLQIILVCKTIIQRPKMDPMNYFIVLFIC